MLYIDHHLGLCPSHGSRIWAILLSNKSYKFRNENKNQKTYKPKQKSNLKLNWMIEIDISKKIETTIILKNKIKYTPKCITRFLFWKKSKSNSGEELPGNTDPKKIKIFKINKEIYET